eukprot:m.31309 g.31309  ORF g.31309 m.31309 type:complete len:399 (+) comp12057_c0_seq1:136-1332(+)
MADLITSQPKQAEVSQSLSAEFEALRTETDVEVTTISHFPRQQPSPPPPAYDDQASTMIALSKRANEPLKRFRTAQKASYEEHRSSLLPVNEYNRCHGCCLCDECCCAPDFKNGLFSCLTCTVCWALPCMIPCFLSELNAALQDRPALCCETVCCPSLYTMRATLRHRRNYPQRPVSDCLAVSMCYPCAAYQTFAEAGLRFSCCDKDACGNTNDNCCYYYHDPSSSTTDDSGPLCDCCCCNCHHMELDAVPTVACPGSACNNPCCRTDGLCGCSVGNLECRPACDCPGGCCVDTNHNYYLDCDCCNQDPGCGIGNGVHCDSCHCQGLAPEGDLCLGCDRLCSGEATVSCEGCCGCCGECVGGCFDACCDCRGGGDGDGGCSCCDDCDCGGCDGGDCNC